jgi:hypothetical protein
MNIALWQKIDSYFRAREVRKAAMHLESVLRAEKADHFTSLCDLQFTNPPETIVRHIESLIELCDSHFQVRAIYLEMNGFDINYDRWYFDSFAYHVYGRDPDDLEWLCEWRSPEYPQITLTGLENIQEDFRWYIEGRIYDQHTHDKAEECAVLLVMTRFVQLIGASLAAYPSSVRVPVLATAHDFDIVGRFEPNA